MPAQKSILITGAAGQLGSEFVELETVFTQYRFLFTSKEALPIENRAALDAYFEKHPVNYCINCAAYTAVDKAEAETEKAFLINANGAGSLAAVCGQYGVPLIHISTDYVFEGNAVMPYKETDPVNPLNVYGASKLKGEELVLQNNPTSLVIRTSWVYGKSGNNFVKTMLRLMKERESIRVVNDQFGSPTSAKDLAAAIMLIIGKLPEYDFKNRVFHYSNQGIISWFDFAVAIKDLSGSRCIVNPIPASQYPTPAKRPFYSALDTSLIQGTFGITIPGWRESLNAVMASVLAG
ncbi:MAG: dTDP-4-dehydrorhamnose reductase [Ferruginibacter sp.]